jgi:hypothetical protein
VLPADLVDRLVERFADRLTATGLAGEDADPWEPFDRLAAAGSAFRVTSSYRPDRARAPLSTLESVDLDQEALRREANGGPGPRPPLTEANRAMAQDILDQVGFGGQLAYEAMVEPGPGAQGGPKAPAPEVEPPELVAADPGCPPACGCPCHRPLSVQFSAETCRVACPCACHRRPHLTYPPAEAARLAALAEGGLVANDEL